MREGTIPPLGDLYTFDRIASVRSAWRLEVRVFGTTRAVDRGGREIVLKTRKARALLAILALRAPHAVLRSELTALLWSRRDAPQARGSLRQALHELHAALEPEARSLLEISRSHVGLRPHRTRIDAAALLEEDADAAALAAYRPTLLADLAGIDPSFDRMLAGEAERLALAARRLAERLLGAALPGSHEAAAIAEQLLALVPAHEAAWQAIIRAHVQAGDRTEAVAAFERCRRQLAEHGLAPGQETVELVETVRNVRPRSTAVLDLVRPAARRAAIRLGVMPLRSLDAGREEDGLSLGLAEEITTALAPFRGLSCVSSTSLGAIAGEARGASPAWRALDLDFLLEGTLQSDSSRYRIMARLLDLRAAESVVWARRFEPEVRDLLAVQDEIASAIAAQVAPEVMLRESDRAAARRVADPTAHDLMLRAIPAIYRLDARTFLAAGEMLEQALRLDPNNAAAHSWLLHWHLFYIGQGWAADPQAAGRRVVDLAARAVTLDPGDARALTLAGHARAFIEGRPQEARALHERALAVNPNLALAWCLSGLSRVYLGQHEDAIREIGQAKALSPYDPHSFFFDQAVSMPHMLLGDYERAVEHGQRAVELNPGFSSSYKPYLATLGHLGRDADAAQVLARLLNLEPTLTVRTAVERSPLTVADDVRAYAEGLRKAGMPEA